MEFSSKNTGVGLQFLLQGIFPTHGLNWRLLHLLPWADGFFTIRATQEHTDVCYWVGPKVRSGFLYVTEKPQ